MILREFSVGSDEYQEELALRARILRAPLGRKLTEADCAKDPLAFHLGGFVKGQLIAVLLLEKIDDSTLKMRQVAVETSFQRSGTGGRLVAFAEELAKLRGYRRLWAHARETAVPFYKKCGYVVSGDSFLEIGLSHRIVTKQLV